MFKKTNEIVDLLKQINHKQAVILTLLKNNRIKQSAKGGRNVKY